MKIEVVFDVNIWVSYFISKRTEQIVDMIANNNVILYRSPKLTKELVAVLERPKFIKYFPDGIQHLILFFENTSKLYRTSDSFSDCADPKDNYLFDLAYQANALYLVSGDHHVLETPVENTLKIVSLTDFLKLIDNH